ncbi:MAG: hypothetical protein ATN36_00415 [Epulopiscium sp. Nele67-Bin005]|nr:MAG: hypothetical protein ATN36_00415 [Epulopiscium sp. Nele67-Bin005]
MMNRLLKDRIIIVMLAYALLILGVGTILQIEAAGFGVGVALGVTISILKFKVMEITLNKAVLMPEGKAKIYSQRHYMVRYSLTGLVLVVCSLTPEISLVGVFLGLLSMKVGAYCELFFMGK